jgi:hypothetical protein
MKEPTAVQSVVVGQDTLVKSPLDPPGGTGTVCIDQFVPFQRTANGLGPLRPTAVHAIESAHDTPLSKLAVPGLGTV